MGDVFAQGNALLCWPSYGLAVDAYMQNRVTGSFLLLDDTTGDTHTAGMIA